MIGFPAIGSDRQIIVRLGGDADRQILGDLGPHVLVEVGAGQDLRAVPVSPIEPKPGDPGEVADRRPHSPIRLAERETVLELQRRTGADRERQSPAFPGKPCRTTFSDRAESRSRCKPRLFPVPRASHSRSSWSRGAETSSCGPWATGPSRKRRSADRSFRPFLPCGRTSRGSKGPAWPTTPSPPSRTANPKS